MRLASHIANAPCADSVWSYRSGMNGCAAFRVDGVGLRVAATRVSAGFTALAVSSPLSTLG